MDEVQELIASLPKETVVDFSNVDFVSLSAAHEFRKLQKAKGLKFRGMNPKVSFIFKLDEIVRGKKQSQNSKFRIIYLSFPRF